MFEKLPNSLDEFYQSVLVQSITALKLNMLYSELNNVFLQLEI